MKKHVKLKDDHGNLLFVKLLEFYGSPLSSNFFDIREGVCDPLHELLLEEIVDKLGIS